MAVPPTRPATRPTGAGPVLPGRRALRVALLMVVPYVLLALAWVFANPAAGAPDEPSHLVKALGVARGDLGVPQGPAPSDTPLIVQRNASITRIVTIPGRVDPHGYSCFAFHGDKLPTCQPPLSARAAGDVPAYTQLGAYPPFVYPPIGLAASLGHTPAQAFLLGRLVVLLETAVLLLLATWHLVRWLGRRALLGVMVFLTPVAVFCMAVVNTSGVEIFGALCVASVVTVYARRPESLLATSTHLVMLTGGTLLVLSRQLGVVAMGVLLVLLLALGGWREVLQGLRRRRPGVIATVAVIGLAAAASAVWELRYDHPAHVGPLVAGPSWRDWWGKAWLPTAESGVGWFGWLEIRMPTLVTDGWLELVAATVVLGVLLARRHRDRVALVAFTAVFAAVAYVVYSSVFHSVLAGLQGRHVLPLLAVLPVFAGAAVAQRLPRVVVGVLFTLLALALPAVQLWGFVLNAQRYAVGLSHLTLDFVPRAQWSPPLGWYPWLVLAAVATVLMAASWVWLGVTSGRDGDAPAGRTTQPAADPAPVTA